MPAAARETRARPVAVVACAEQDVPALMAVVRGLVARNMRVDLTPVGEENLGALENAVERYGSGASYVVCHTPGLARYLADLCELTVRAAEVPEDRIVSAWLDPDEPEAFASSVCRWAQDGAFPNLRDVLTDTAEGRAPKKSPQVTVHTPAPAANDGQAAASSSDRPYDASTTRHAMRMALGWRRFIRPTVLFVACFAVVFAAAYAYDLV